MKGYQIGIKNILRYSLNPYSLLKGYYLSFTNKLPKAKYCDKQYFISKLETTKSKTSEAVIEFEKKTNKKINPRWLYKIALRTQITKSKKIKSFDHGRLLYSAISYWIEKNKKIDNIKVFEIGTARGFSSLCMAKALKDNNKKGTITTLDKIPHERKMYWNCISDIENKKSRKELLEDWIDLVKEYIIFIRCDSKKFINNYSSGRIHVAFLDGAHTYKDVMNESKFVSKSQSKGDLIIYDDFNKELFPGLVEAVLEFSKKNEYILEIIEGNDNRNYVIAKKL